MTDQNNTANDKPALGNKTLSLKKPAGSAEQGFVKQSFSHGRTKAVVVEKKPIKRRFGPDGKPIIEQDLRPVAPAPVVVAPAPVAKPIEVKRNEPKPQGLVLRSLSDAEKDARMQALSDSRVREAEERRIAEERAKLAAEAARIAAEEKAAADARAKEDDDRRKAAADDRRKEDVSEATRRFAAAPTARSDTPRPSTGLPANRSASPSAPRSGAPRPGGAGLSRPLEPIVSAVIPSRAPIGRKSDEDDRRGGKVAEVKPVKKDAMPDKFRGRLTLSNALNEDTERSHSLSAFRRRQQRQQRKAMGTQEQAKVMREVTVPEVISISDLANRMSERAVDVIKLLMKQGMMHKITDIIDADTAQLVAEELGHTVKRVADSDVEEGLFLENDVDLDLVPRPAVVTIMGHVDHGKTSLLDTIRKANVVAGEAGGITQHIGAYQITRDNGAKITFIDTPGHEAFTSMRARGAKVTDIVVLVVAADDGVKPQTIEALNHAKQAGVPMIVAVNKIDKPDANPDRVRIELLQHEVLVESMGGDVLEVAVSAKQNLNIDKLLDAIQLQTEILNLKSNPNRAAEGTVIEAKLDKGRGPVATVLVQRGTLKNGDIVVAGSAWGKVRGLVNDLGIFVPTAEPSVPVEILGFNSTPEAGDVLAVVETEARAREIADFRDRKKKDKQQAKASGLRGSLADMMASVKTKEGMKEFLLVIKGDVQGSVEAIIGSLDKLGTDEVKARILHSGVGGITESDVTLASASNAAIIGFNVRANKQARELAERERIELRYYNIIYDLVDDVKQAMSGLLAPEAREEMLGLAEILEVFNIGGVGKIGGCRVSEGVLQRGARVRLLRESVVIHDGKLSTLKRFKDEVKEVQAGQECGAAFEGYFDLKAGDQIECYKVTEIQRSL